MKWVFLSLTLSLGLATSAHAQYASFVGVQGQAFNNVNVAPAPYYNASPYLAPYAPYVPNYGHGSYGLGNFGYGSGFGGYGYGAGFGGYGAGFGYASGINFRNYGIAPPLDNSPQVLVINSGSKYGSFVGNNFGAGDVSNYQSPYRPFIPSVFTGYDSLRPGNIFSPFIRN